MSKKIYLITIIFVIIFITVWLAPAGQKPEAQALHNCYNQCGQQLYPHEVRKGDGTYLYTKYFPMVIHDECFCTQPQLAEKVQNYNQECHDIIVHVPYQPHEQSRLVCNWVPK